MLICVLGFGHIWSAKPGRVGGPAAYFNTTGILASGKYRHRSCVYGHIRIDECTGFHPIRADRWLFRVFGSEPMTIWNGSRKLFLKEHLAKSASPERYLARISSAELGWIDRQAPWMCDSSEVISFSEGNGQQEVLVLLPAFGWISSGSGLFHLVPDGERPWRAAFKCPLNDAGGWAMSKRQDPNQRDGKVLEIVATAKWITHRQLSDIAKITRLEKNDNRKVFEWRVRRLSEWGLLKKQRPPFLNQAILYSITKNGIFCLETIGIHPLSLAYDHGDPKSEGCITHALELNRVWISLLRSGMLSRWLPDSAIRVLLRAGSQEYAKVYDAVATLREGYELCKIGIEYERSLKAIERYQEIVCKLNDERGVHAVLYLCPNRDALRTITDVFFQSKKPVIAALMEDFVANPLGGRAEVNLLSTTLQAELRKICHQQAAITVQRAKSESFENGKRLPVASRRS